MKKYALCTATAISIHALAKRATGLTGDFARRRYISIHALAKRATYKRAGAEPCYRHFNPRPRKEGDGFRPHQIQNQNHFNPRPRKEGDYFVYENNKSMSNISIHALAKRATSAGTHTVYPRSNFNPRPRKEGDAIGPELPATLMGFQSTPSQRGRLHVKRTCSHIIIFQSTPSQRGRP